MVTPAADRRTIVAIAGSRMVRAAFRALTLAFGRDRLSQICNARNAVRRLTQIAEAVERSCGNPVGAMVNKGAYARRALFFLSFYEHGFCASNTACTQAGATHYALC